MPLPAHALPDVWRAHELARSHTPGLDTGHAALNAVLPGGGWPLSSLTEVLQPRPGCGEWGLLAPALAQLCRPDRVRRSARQAVLVGAPHAPLGAALAAWQLDARHLLCVQATSMAERLWAAEQALRCADVAAVLLWLPQAQPAQLRRLHLAAQDHAKLLFVLRPESAQHDSSPAPLRLLLGWRDDHASDHARAHARVHAQALPAEHSVPPLWVRVLKRRGPPLEACLPLLSASPGVQALLAASRAQARLRRANAVHSWQVGQAVQERVHALDRTASLA